MLPVWQKIKSYSTMNATQKQHKRIAKMQTKIIDFQQSGLHFLQCAQPTATPQASENNRQPLAYKLLE
jgi:hypothetical protein